VDVQQPALAKRTQSIEQQDKAQPWFLLSEEGEEDKEAFSSGGYLSDED